mmetsp:Transcript_66307/g.209607  ORF Transcript_66307/g.209607 Transcript_66307/m.209607 type:complete len:203 (+) Transcript_66307:571-1179(+)
MRPPRSGFPTGWVPPRGSTSMSFSPAGVPPSATRATGCSRAPTTEGRPSRTCSTRGGRSSSLEGTSAARSCCGARPPPNAIASGSWFGAWPTLPRRRGCSCRQWSSSTCTARMPSSPTPTTPLWRCYPPRRRQGACGSPGSARTASMRTSRYPRGGGRAWACSAARGASQSRSGSKRTTRTSIHARWLQSRRGSRARGGQWS